MDTDILAGIESELDSVLVLSGVTDMNTMGQFAYRPYVKFGPKTFACDGGKLPVRVGCTRTIIAKGADTLGYYYGGSFENHLLCFHRPQIYLPRPHWPNTPGLFQYVVHNHENVMDLMGAFSANHRNLSIFG